MKDVLSVIAELKGLRHLTPAKKTDVFLAECALDVRFAEDYKTYVEAYGVITARGVEITGISESPRLSVVSVTERERGYNPQFPADMYVIESSGDEGLVVAQNADGQIFYIQPGKAPKKKFGSLADFLSVLQKDLD